MPGALTCSCLKHLLCPVAALQSQFLALLLQVVHGGARSDSPLLARNLALEEFVLQSPAHEPSDNNLSCQSLLELPGDAVVDGEMRTAVRHPVKRVLLSTLQSLGQSDMHQDLSVHHVDRGDAFSLLLDHIDGSDLTKKPHGLSHLTFG